MENELTPAERSRRQGTQRFDAIARVEQLVAQGRSRLTAHRIVEIERNGGEASRARKHPTARR